MLKTRERKLFIVRERPRQYPQTPQQLLFKKAIKECGIKKGISREDLVKAMKECLPAYFAKIEKIMVNPSNVIKTERIKERGAN